MDGRDVAAWREASLGYKVKVLLGEVAFVELFIALMWAIA